MESIAVSPQTVPFQVPGSVAFAGTAHLTLQDCLDREDFSPLDELIRHYCGSYLRKDPDPIEYVDDYWTGEKRKLIYNARTTVYTDYSDSDEDGKRRATEDVTKYVSVEVWPADQLDIVARLLASEVRGIEGNVFA